VVVVVFDVIMSSWVQEVACTLAHAKGFWEPWNSGLIGCSVFQTTNQNYSGRTCCPVVAQLYNHMDIFARRLPGT